jgi:hypothetical protein
VSFWRPEFKPGPGQISSVINGFVETHTVLHSMHLCQKLGGLDSLSDKDVGFDQ